MRLPRSSGVLLHPTSLPGPFGCGDLGADAHAFVDWLAAARQTIWQILPIHGVGPGNSPYMGSSAFAGNPMLVDLADLLREGWLDAADLQPQPELLERRIDFGAAFAFRLSRLAKAAQRFAARASPAQRADYDAFRDEQRRWLDDYALFMAICEREQQRGWCEWPAELARREPAALALARRQLATPMAFHAFCQWRFFRQWAALRSHAAAKGVRLVGDVPIFVALQSADVWQHPHLFELDPSGRPTVVAGVPPDYFSATGQRWGNPLYRWSAHAADGYAWWVDRLRGIFDLVDVVRIDHFRGFAAHWEIPASETTAVNGRWVTGPGRALFDAIEDSIGRQPIIAEDLGVITADVDALRRDLALPGMLVLHFAFGGDAANRYLPHLHDPHSVVYTGTHDNNTTLGWWRDAREGERAHVRAYLDTDGSDISWTLIRCAMASVADTCVVPMQDVLALPGECRMNLPGDSGDWWTWRFAWSQVQPAHGEKLAAFARLYGRAAG